MNPRILGLHHITAIAGQAQRNHDFYSKLLGLRLVKKTVNFDDPNTYHFYFGDTTGAAGTILTFFPGGGVATGRPGIGQASAVSYSVPAGSFPFWMQRFEERQVPYQLLEERFGEPCLAFTDPDGLALELVVSNTYDERVPWTTMEVGAAVALRGFHAVQLTLGRAAATVALLTEVFGYRVLRQQGACCRLITDAVPEAAIVDVIETVHGSQGHVAGGSVHHVAFRVADDAALLYFREVLVRRGLNVTPQIDRQYFHSVYFREPGGVLFEIATDNPGFLIDEPPAELGTHLLLPPQHEARRAQITAHLPQIL